MRRKKGRKKVYTNCTAAVLGKRFRYEDCYNSAGEECRGYPCRSTNRSMKKRAQEEVMQVYVKMMFRRMVRLNREEKTNRVRWMKFLIKHEYRAVSVSMLSATG